MITRRELLQRCSNGFGGLALAALLGRRLAAQDPCPPHFAPRAKNVIFLFMSGGVSQVDSFDPKPRLARDHGKPMPLPVRRTQFNQNGNLMASPWKFRRHGKSGLEISDLFPHIASCADELAVVRSMTAMFNEHAQANYFLHTGFPFLGHPSAGAWAAYGLGSECENLPGFVVLQSGRARVPHGGMGLFSNAFLPASVQASVLHTDRDEPVRNVQPTQPVAAQRRRLDLVRQLDREFAERIAEKDPIESAIRNDELAFQMQTAIPELGDFRDEPTWLKSAYGFDDSDSPKAGYARQCLLARRLVERGVRFVELSCLAYNIGGGNAPNPWDQHSQLEKGHGRMANQVDQPIAALIRDLRSRGLLDETLVIWAGEFGRTPFSQGSDGRDHDPHGFSIWMAGAGIRGGTIYGSTDEFGYHAEDRPCDLYDLWATVLHLLGLDHQRLTFRHGGRDLRLTDVHGNVLHDILS